MKQARWLSEFSSLSKFTRHYSTYSLMCIVVEQNVSEYDHLIPQSHTVDQSTAPYSEEGRDT